MGAYLHIGFVAKASIQISKNVTLAKLKKELSGYYPAKLFDYTQVDEKNIVLSIKPSILKVELVDFVKEIYEDYHDEWSMTNNKKTIAFIGANIDNPDWLEKAEKKDLDNFSIQGYGLSESFTIGGEKIWVTPSIVTLGSEGKFSMEQSGKTLEFMEICAQRAYSNYKLASAFRVYVM
jgi:hypothetical protein